MQLNETAEKVAALEKQVAESSEALRSAQEEAVTSTDPNPNPKAKPDADPNLNAEPNANANPTSMQSDIPVKAEKLPRRLPMRVRGQGISTHTCMEGRVVRRVV